MHSKLQTMTNNRKPRFIEPKVLPQWAFIMFNLQSVQDRYFAELMKDKPHEDTLDWLESEMVSKSKQLEYLNFKFN